MLVEGKGGGMPVIDRLSGGRHFYVTIGATLTLRSVRLINGRVSGLCTTGSSDSGADLLTGGCGAIVCVHHGKLVLEQAWLSGGRAYQGGGIYAFGPSAQVQAQGSTFSGNSADVSRVAAARICF